MGKTDKFLALIVILYFIIFSSLSILKHLSFFSTGYDLGIYNQAMWGFINFKLPTSLMETHLFGGHIEPILFLLLPFYWIYPHPITLVVIQTFFIAVSAIPLYLLANEKFKNKKASLIISIAYLFYLPLWYINLFDFHPSVLALPFIMFALYFLIKKKYKLFVVSMIFVSASKEYFSLLFIPIGVYLFVKHKKRKLALITALLGLLWFVICVMWIIPYFLGSSYFYFRGNISFGDTLPEIAKTFIFNPFVLVRELLKFNRIAYLILLLAPIGMGIFSLFGFEFLLLGSTEFLIVLLNSQKTIPEIVYHHQVTLIPFVMVATIVGISRFIKIFKRHKFVNLYTISIFILFTSIISNSVYGSFSVLYDLKDFDVTSDYVKAGNKIISMIPSNASVSAPNWVVAHLSNRDNVYMLDHLLRNSTYMQERGNPEYIVLDFSDAIDDPKRSGRRVNLSSYDIALNNSDYNIIYQKNTWVLFKWAG